MRYASFVAPLVRRCLATLAALGGAATALLAAPATARACLWDSDTLAMERTRFPGAYEIVAGQFPRHSRAYYTWRIADRARRLTATPEAAPLFDDTAVAYEKLGDHASAIYVMSMLETIAPGRYETYANLGTFYLHAGDFPHGIAFIDHALQINPDAHFGREIYQRALAEYVSQKRVNGVLHLPLWETTEDRYLLPGGFARFLEERKIPRGAAALKGVLGMMVFGDPTSPILLEALANLLLAPADVPLDKDGFMALVRATPKDAKQLAARAYLRAEQSATEPAVKKSYHQLALVQMTAQAIPQDTPNEVKLQALEIAFAREIAQGDALVAEIARNEQRWVDQGKDLDKEYAARYGRVPVPGVGK
jgi:tetratricopeptide (TPR) repeat protein